MSASRSSLLEAGWKKSKEAFEHGLHQQVLVQADAALEHSTNLLDIVSLEANKTISRIQSAMTTGDLPSVCKYVGRLASLFKELDGTPLLLYMIVGYNLGWSRFGCGDAAGACGDIVQSLQALQHHHSSIQEEKKKKRVVKKEDDDDEMNLFESSEEEEEIHRDKRQRTNNNIDNHVNNNNNNNPTTLVECISLAVDWLVKHQQNITDTEIAVGNLVHLSVMLLLATDDVDKCVAVLNCMKKVDWKHIESIEEHQRDSWSNTRRLAHQLVAYKQQQQHELSQSSNDSSSNHATSSVQQQLLSRELLGQERFREAELTAVSAASLLPLHRSGESLCVVAAAMSQQGNHWGALNQLKCALKTQSDGIIKSFVIRNIAREYHFLHKYDAEAEVLKLLTQSEWNNNNNHSQQIPCKFVVSSSSSQNSVDFDEASLRLAALDVASGRIKEALSSLRTLCSSPFVTTTSPTDPRSQYARMLLGRALVAADKYQEALNVVETIQRDDATNPNAICLHGAALLCKGSVLDALALTTSLCQSLEGVQGDTKRLSRALSNRGLLLICNGRVQEAEIAIGDAHRLNPKDGGIVFNYAEILCRCGKSSDAVTVWFSYRGISTRMSVIEAMNLESSRQAQLSRLSPDSGQAVTSHCAGQLSETQIILLDIKIIRHYRNNKEKEEA